ncbi:MAG: biotin--[acetyl-CoA-carboxylase] ligase, partial [Fervidicoccaceae archaeon]
RQVEQKMSKLSRTNIEIFKLLLERGKLSGEALSRELGISRATVSRRVKELNENGFFINADDEGYSVPSNDLLLFLNNFLGKMRASLQYRAVLLDSCDSSQDLAEDMARRGAEEGSFVICGEIKSARGRLGRRWIANRGGLWLSLILKPGFIEGIHLISLALGVSFAQGIEEVLGVSPKLKWPNDIMIAERKVGGILVEAKVDPDGFAYAIAGVGINVNNDIEPFLKQEAASLKNIVGREVPIIPLLGRSLYLFSQKYENLKAKRTQEIILQWKAMSMTLGRRVKAIFKPDDAKEGIAVDIASDGSLILQLDSGEKVRIYAGDIVHLR